MFDGYPFEFLVDSPEDGGMEEHAWFPAPTDTAAGVLEAFCNAYIEHPLEQIDHEFTLQLGPREWHQATLDVYDDEGDELEELTGAEAIKQAAERGTEEGLRFHKVEPGEEGALPWWRIDLVEKCGILLGEDEDEIQIKCNLVSNHEGACVQQRFLVPHP